MTTSKKCNHCGEWHKRRSEFCSKQCYEADHRGKAKPMPEPAKPKGPIKIGSTTIEWDDGRTTKENLALAFSVAERLNQKVIGYGVSSDREYVTVKFGDKDAD